MASLFSFGVLKDKTKKQKTPKSKHEKLPEHWGNNEKATSEGATFYVDYLGSTLLEELDEGKSYGNKKSAEAVRAIVTMAKGSNKTLQKMTINVSPEGIKVMDSASGELRTDLSIYRIHFCTADKNHEKVFAYIARSTENETMECHAFLCPKKKVAQAVTLTVAEAFQIAKAKSEKAEEDARKAREEAPFLNPSPSKKAPAPPPPGPPAPAESSQPATGILVNLSEPPAADQGGGKPAVESATSSHHASTAQQQQGFDDNFTDADPFASFAESRAQSSTSANPFMSSSFSTDLQLSDVDQSVRNLVNGQDQQSPHHGALML